MFLRLLRVAPKSRGLASQNRWFQEMKGKKSENLRGGGTPKRRFSAAKHGFNL